MKELKPWLIIAILSYLFFLVWSLPADRVLSYMSDRGLLPDQLVLTSGPLGSWHNGRIAGILISGTEIAELHWELQPAGLLLGRLQFAMDCKLRQGRSSWTLQITKNTFAIKKLRGKLTADILGQALPGFELSGLFESKGMSFVFRDGLVIKADGQAAWKGAGLGNPYNMALGDLTLALTTDISGIRIKVSDNGGPLQAAIIGFLDPGGQYSVDGTISARQGSPPDLATFLQILGRPGNDGMIRVSTKGNLPRLK
jgi:hypothetical protein